MNVLKVYFLKNIRMGSGFPEIQKNTCHTYIYIYIGITRNIFTLGGGRLQAEGDILLILMKGHAVDNKMYVQYNT